MAKRIDLKTVDAADLPTIETNDDEELGDGFSYRFENGVVFITVEGREYNLANLLKINSTSAGVSAALQNHSARYSYWAAISAEADADEREAKDEIRRTEALVYRYHKTRTYVAPEKPPTVEDMKAIIAIDETVCSAVRLWQYCALKSGMLKSAVRSMETRGEHLRSLNSNIRSDERQNNAA